MPSCLTSDAKEFLYSLLDEKLRELTAVVEKQEIENTIVINIGRRIPQNVRSIRALEMLNEDLEKSKRKVEGLFDKVRMELDLIPVCQTEL